MSSEKSILKDSLGSYFVEKPLPLVGAETIQLILLREIQDFTVLRTEETRELNTVATPLSVTKNGQTVRRVAFLGSKQKAAESRVLEQMLRTATRDAGLRGHKECYLKDNLCLECPRCGLFGGTSTEAGAERVGNIKHRIEYSTAFSLLPFEDVETNLTFNAIDEKTQTTGQALGNRYAVTPVSIFPSIVALRSVTEREFILAVKTLLATKSYGAESRVGGDVRNNIVGVVAGWEEIITPLELTLEFYDRQDTLGGQQAAEIAEKYIAYAANPDKVRILELDAVDSLVSEVAETRLSKEFLEACYADIKEYREFQKDS